MRFKVLPALAALALATAFPAPGAAAAAPAPAADSRPVAELAVTDAVILGVIEGITEFLPVSSTGHLIVASRFLHLDSEQPLTDAAGRPVWYRVPSARHPGGVPLTMKLAADTYNIVIQFGAIAAVLLLYWQPILAMARGALGRDPAGRRLLGNVVLAFLPAAVIGLLVHDWIDAHLFSIGAVIIAQTAGAFLMFYAESWRRRHAAAPAQGPEILELSPPAALRIGFLQCVAMWPGTSRSMMTIVGGYFSRLNPRHAAEFSFLLGFATLTAATVFKSYQSGRAMIQVFGWPHVLLGGVVAAVTAAIAVRFLVTWLTRHGLAIFGVYRLVVAAVLAVLFFR